MLRGGGDASLLSAPVKISYAPHKSWKKFGPSLPLLWTFPRSNCIEKGFLPSLFNSPSPPPKWSTRLLLLLHFVLWLYQDISDNAEEEGWVGLGRLGCEQASTFLPLPLRYPMTTSSFPPIVVALKMCFWGVGKHPHTPLFCWAAGHSTLRHPFFPDIIQGGKEMGVFL